MKDKKQQKSRSVRGGQREAGQAIKTSTNHPGHCPKGEGCKLEASTAPKSLNRNRKTHEPKKREQGNNKKVMHKPKAEYTIQEPNKKCDIATTEDSKGAQETCKGRFDKEQQVREGLREATN